MRENSGVTNIFIENVLRGRCVDFIGVFSSDQIPNLSTFRRCTLIVNYDTHFQYGSHFVTILISENNLLYIDSLGLFCFSDLILKAMIATKKRVFYNARPIQDFKSNFCGLFSILFCMLGDEKIKGKPKKLFFSQTDLMKNDKICLDLIVRLLKLNTR